MKQSQGKDQLNSQHGNAPSIVANPTVISVQLTPVTLTKNEGWFRVGNSNAYLVVRKAKKKHQDNSNREQ